METEKNSLKISISTTTVVKVIAIVLSVYLMYLIRDILMILFISLVLASALDPWVDWLQKRKIPRSVGVLLLYLATMSVLILSVYLITPPIANEVRDLSSNLPQYQQKVSGIFSSFKEFSEKNTFFKSLSDNLGSLSSNLEGAAGGVFSTVVGIFGGLVSFIMILFITFYMVVQESSMKRLVWILTPAKNQEYILELINRMQKKIGLWLRGQLILCVIIFVMVYPGLLILKVKYALVLALIAGITEAVPYIGPLLGAIPAIFLAFTQSPILALFVAAFFYVVQLIENNILVPKIMEKAVGLNPIISIVAFLIGFNLGGIPGAILSIPVAAAISVFIGDIFENRRTGKVEPKF